MGKRKSKGKGEAPRAMVAPTPLPPELADATDAAEQTPRGPKYSFPTAGIQCPRCLSIDTIRVSHSEDGRVQYRRCRRGHCRYNFKVVGKVIA